MNRFLRSLALFGLALAMLPLAPAPPALAAPQPYTLVLLPGIDKESGKICVSGQEACDGQRSRSLLTFGPLLNQLPPGSYGSILNYNYSPYWATENAYYSDRTHQSIATSADMLTGQLQKHLRERPGARFVLVGYSLGGAVAAYWAATAPPDLRYTVQSIVTLDSPLGGIGVLVGIGAEMFFCNCQAVWDLESKAVKDQMALGVTQIDTVNLWNADDDLWTWVSTQPASWQNDLTKLGCLPKSEDYYCHGTIIASARTAQWLRWVLEQSPPIWTARKLNLALSGASLVGPANPSVGTATSVKITVRAGSMGVPVIGRVVVLASSRNQAGTVDAIGPSLANIPPLPWCTCWGTGYGGFAPGEAIFSVISSTPGVAYLQAYDVTGGWAPLGQQVVVTFGQQAQPPPAAAPSGGVHVRYAGGEGAIQGTDFKFSIGQRADGTREGWWVQSGGPQGNWAGSSIASIEAQGGVASVWGFGKAPWGADISFNLLVRSDRYEMHAWTVQGVDLGSRAGDLIGGSIRVVGPPT